MLHLVYGINSATLFFSLALSVSHSPLLALPGIIFIIDLLLSSSVASSHFHSRIKTHLFQKFLPTHLPPSGLPSRS